jgi:hypothetical protein
MMEARASMSLMETQPAMTDDGTFAEDSCLMLSLPYAWRWKCTSDETITRASACLNLQGGG